MSKEERGPIGGSLHGADLDITLSEEGWALLGPLDVGTECVATIDGRQVRLVLCGWDLTERRLCFLIPIDQVERDG